ncbi:MAG: 5-bromo-4-chloroindolyl phosphate hydrolysis family protein [Clostridia bacterium]|nr:5-bromo-4-chloroindolyl phosphate hydrolysis family protein [Clostridia bacterium]
MDTFLTEKARARRKWEIPAAGLSGLFVAAGIEVFVEEAAEGGMGYIDVVAYAVVIGAFVAPLVLVLLRWLRRSRAQSMAKALERCPEASLPFAELDRVLKVKNAPEKLQKLISKGYLQRLRPDWSGLMLWLERPQAAVQSAPEAPEEDSSASVLKRIRALNDAIDDAAVSEKIDRIEALTAGIFRTVQERPERAAEVRRFVNYYLPTTLKLLESYSLMEKQSYQGENIQASRRGIEQALGKVVTAIEQQQDRLFRSEKLDVETEIQVLETMMASDGLGRVSKIPEAHFRRL